MRKTGIGRELKNESVACRPCSLNFADKSLREVYIKNDYCQETRKTDSNLHTLLKEMGKNNPYRVEGGKLFPIMKMTIVRKPERHTQICVLY